MAASSWIWLLLVTVVAIFQIHLLLAWSLSPQLSNWPRPSRRSSSYGRGMLSFSSSSSSSAAPLMAESYVGVEDGKPRRRRRKNKYEIFSKVNSEKDPLEQLMVESREKNKQLTQEERERKQRRNNHNKPIDEPLRQVNMAFPDAKNLDPYDPSTFGYIEIGCIVGAHGVHGWVKVQSTTDFGVERLCTSGIRHLKPANKRAPRQVSLVNGKPLHARNEYLVQLDGITDRDAAHKLRGSVLYVREEEKVVPTLLQLDEYLVSDLVGLEVFLYDDDNHHHHQERVLVGKVGGVVFPEDISAGVPGLLGHDMLEILLMSADGCQEEAPTDRRQQEYVLIPFVPQIVPKVELQEGAIFIDPPFGLLNLTYTKEEKVRIKGFLAAATDTRSFDKQP